MRNVIESVSVITYGLTVPQSIHAVAGAGIAAGKQSTAD
jgi:hypothetical protein